MRYVLCPTHCGLWNYLQDHCSLCALLGNTTVEAGGARNIQNVSTVKEQHCLVSSCTAPVVGRWQPAIGGQITMETKAFSPLSWVNEMMLSFLFLSVLLGDCFLAFSYLKWTCCSLHVILQEAFIDH